MTRPPKVSRALQRETDVQRAVTQFFRKAGCHVYSLAQGRKTRQTPGLPDLYVIHPSYGAWWFECKVPGGKLSAAQAKFADQCWLSKIAYYWGGTKEAQSAMQHAVGWLP